MKECFRCGISEGVKFFDVLLDEGIVCVCKTCAMDENMPRVKPPIDPVNDDSSSKLSVYERLSAAAGIDPKKHKGFDKEDENKYAGEGDVMLKEIVDKNILYSSFKKIDSNSDFIRNFHWIIMRARRLKKLSQSQLAKEISEPEEAIKMIEKGVLINENFNLIKKLELYLGIQLLKKEVANKKVDNKISFDSIISQSLTIDDLREMKKEKEEKIFLESKPKKEEVLEKIKKESDVELTSKEIDDIIFGKRD